MANKRRDITGEVFGKLTAIAPIRPDGAGRWVWLFKCECGQLVERNSYRVISSKRLNSTPHCGCSPSLKTHGLSNEFKKLNWVWVSMKQRCNNTTCKDYARYGARGIKVCNEWLDFKNFHSWAMSSGYKKNVTIERIDVNKGYHPDNCTWIENEKQALNREHTVKFDYKGSRYTIRELSQLAGISYYTMKGRLMNYGWNTERAVNEPAFKGKNKTYKG
jgi:hypothetical protein